MTQSTHSEKNLLAQFEAQVARKPDAIALLSPQEKLSYAELGKQVDHIASALQSCCGVSDKTDESQLIGLCMPRSVDAVCAMLGILKAGGAYLPIDPASPSELQQRMVRRAGLQCLLTDPDIRQAVWGESRPSRLQVLTLPELKKYPQKEKESARQPLQPSVISNDRLFHVLYTSGSTDEPKGVCGTYKQMQARLEWFWRAFPLSDMDVCCQKTALHFVDASLEIFGSLLAGRPLLIAPDTYSSNPEKLINLLAEYQVTRISMVVSQLRALLIADARLENRLPQLELFIVSGERLTRDLMNAFSQALPHAQLVNLYGCSEVPEISYCTIHGDTSTSFADYAPIGYPIDGTEIRIIDESFQEVIPGDIGELLVGSTLQASGYLNLPEETHSRFIDNPFGSTQKLYRTGDRVRMAPDGLLFFMGRTDDQVKIRGYRIEISAVETLLKGCNSDLNAVAVVVQEDPLLLENRSLVAFVTPRQVDTHALLRTQRTHIPKYMQVQRIIALDKLPSTASGKIDRRKLTERAQSSLATKQGDPDNIQATVRQLWKAVLLVDAIENHEKFFEVGGDSLRLAQLHQSLCSTFPEFNLSLAELFELPTLASQVNYIQQMERGGATPIPSSGTKKQYIRPCDNQGQDIAVISMACRFPDAVTPEAFWNNLRSGTDSVSDFSLDDLEQPDAQLRNHPDYVKSAAILLDIADFDADFFGFSEKEATLLDPQQRLLLECAWEAIERAGVVPADMAGRVGVYAGSSASSYFINNVIKQRPVTEATLAEYQENLANDRNFLATQIAYRLQLTGPAINIQTACSTGLVGIHLACQALRAGECEVALAASIALKIPQKAGYLFEEGMIRSADGRCRAFDAQAEGTLFSSGGGAVLLKPLAAAQAEGDPILAVIKGSAVNNDGAARVGYTAPSLNGQAEVVAAALQSASVNPHTIGYVEGHGTGTRLGDPIEVKALTRAYRQSGWSPETNSNVTQQCALGSVKTNLGHLDEAAGMAGFIKTVLALQHAEIPPTLHFKTPNPDIDFANSPFYVNTALTPWPIMATSNTPRRAGVSAFGMGGTNCHMVLEQAPAIQPKVVSATSLSAPKTPVHHLLTLSATNERALIELVERYHHWLLDNPSVELADMCATTAVSRSHFPCRYATVATSTQALKEQLAHFSPPATSGVLRHDKGEKIAFLFTGQGAQYPDMARQLYKTSTHFRASIDRCAAILNPLLPLPLLSVMFADEGTQAASLLSQTRYTQPALFAVEFALAKLWQSWGVEPDLVMGHSVGEYVAACIAGVFKLEEALYVIAERGRLIQALPAGGGMLAVALEEDKIEQLTYAERICIAAVNGPFSTVISGDLVTLDLITEQLKKQGISYKHLDVSHAFHSASMEPMLGSFADTVDKCTLKQPRIPVISNLSGEVVSAELTDPAYWVKHTRYTVRFMEGIKTLQSHGVTTILELGPTAVLLPMIAEIAEHTDGWREAPLLLPSLRYGKDDWAQLLESLGQLYTSGYTIKWPDFYQERAWHKQVLPTMPFQRKRYWVEPTPSTRLSPDAYPIKQPLTHDLVIQAAERLWAQGELTEDQRGVASLLAAEAAALHQAIGQPDQEKWHHLLYKTVWQRAPDLPAPLHDKGSGIESMNTPCWLILADDHGTGAALAAYAEAAGIKVFLLFSGDLFTSTGSDRWTIDPSDPVQFADFWGMFLVERAGRPIQRLVYLWGLNIDAPKAALSTDDILRHQQVICGSLLNLLPKLVANDDDEQAMQLWLITRTAQSLRAENSDILHACLNPLQSTLWGVGRSLALEYPRIWGGLIDLPVESVLDTEALSLWRELNGSSLPSQISEQQVAFKDKARYVARLQPVIQSKITRKPSIKADATYLITGGLGALGLEVAELLVGLGVRHLILLSRSGVTTEAQHQRLQLWYRQGVMIQTPQLDISDQSALNELFPKHNRAADQAGSSYPPLKGIIHAAGNIASTASAQPNWLRFSAVMQAKVIGGWNLHVLSQQMDLDFFVLFSSASSLLGLGGHADYAAANAFLDALADYRNQLGLPALSISWGDWADTGMATHTNTQKALIQTGMGALSLPQAHAAFCALLNEQGHWAIIRADWPRFVANFQAHQGFLCALSGQKPARETTEKTTETINAAVMSDYPDIQSSLKTANDSLRETLLQHHLTCMIGGILGRAVSNQESSVNLLSLGFDSLMLIELRNQLRQVLGLQIELTHMLQGPSIDELVVAAHPLFSTAASSADHSQGEGQCTTIVI